MTLPSKELLSAVLNETIYDVVNDLNTPINMFQYEIEKRMLDGSGIAFREINIHELAHKCKQWAYKNGYSIISGINTVGDGICHIMKCTGYSQDYYYEQSENYDNVFQACEWILKETK